MFGPDTRESQWKTERPCRELPRKTLPQMIATPRKHARRFLSEEVVVRSSCPVFEICASASPPASQPKFGTLEAVHSIPRFGCFLPSCGLDQASGSTASESPMVQTREPCKFFRTRMPLPLDCVSRKMQQPTKIDDLQPRQGLTHLHLNQSHLKPPKPDKPRPSAFARLLDAQALQSLRGAGRAQNRTKAGIA